MNKLQSKYTKLSPNVSESQSVYVNVRSVRILIFPEITFTICLQWIALMM